MTSIEATFLSPAVQDHAPAGADPDRRPIALFYSYSHRDEHLRDDLERHLTPLKHARLISEWHDRRITLGETWEGEINQYLDTADIILLLVSASFIASEYCWNTEMKRALERHESGQATIIPVILRPCLWQETPLGRFQAVPTDGRPVTTWPDQDQAFTEIAEAIRKTITKKRDGLHEDEPLSLLSSDAQLSDFFAFQDIKEPWCPEMIVLPPGTFTQGAPDDEKEAWPEETPQRLAKLEHRFAVSAFPITFFEYDYFCEAGGWEKPQDEGWGRGRRPVINVSWRDADAYVRWLRMKTGNAYRLPTETEWEYVCRAATTTPYTFGGQLSESAANFDSTLGKTSEIGRYPENAWGFFDVHGNVWEWVEDFWHANYQGAPVDGSAWLSDGKLGCRVLRGGSWRTRPRQLRSAARMACPAELRANFVGFRIARELSPTVA